jgi:hypothetical protein
MIDPKRERERERERERADLFCGGCGNLVVLIEKFRDSKMVGVKNRALLEP